MSGVSSGPTKFLMASPHTTPRRGPRRPPPTPPPGEIAPAKPALELALSSAGWGITVSASSPRVSSEEPTLGVERAEEVELLRGGGLGRVDLGRREHVEPGVLAHLAERHAGVEG